MAGTEVRAGRKARRFTQVHLAHKLGVSQAYVSLLETNQRRVPRRLALKLASLLQLPSSTLPVTSQTRPLPSERVAGTLGTLGYPGFAYLHHNRKLNPAEFLVRTLRRKNLDARLVEALPWVVARNPTLDWKWLLPTAKQNDLQNRLGFVVTVARQLAERQNDPMTATKLRKWEGMLEHSRLQQEDAFAGDTLTEAERRWLRANRPPEAEHWNVLTNVRAEHIERALHERATLSTRKA